MRANSCGLYVRDGSAEAISPNAEGVADRHRNLPRPSWSNFDFTARGSRSGGQRSCRRRNNLAQDLSPTPNVAQRAVCAPARSSVGIAAR